MHRDANFEVELFALAGRKVGLGQKLSVGQHRGQRMPQVVRDRTGHGADGGQPLGVQQALLRMLQALAHSGERLGHLADLAILSDVKRKRVVSLAQRTHAIDQRSSGRVKVLAMT